MTVTLADMGGWPAVLGAAVAGRDLSGDEASAAMSSILEGEATSAQIAGFCIALRSKGETVEEMTGLLASMLDHAEPMDLPPGPDAVDTCGTGGDKQSTINVSTLAAFVVAGAGARVCKHGNRAVTSACGSADLLEALGVAIDLPAPGVAACIEQVGMGFCFAPRFHAALRHAGPTRRELGVPTVFNYLGPLANPSRLRRQVLGVNNADMAARMAGVLQARGAERALVVYGHDGLDELSTAAPSTVLDVENGEIRTYQVDPAALGLASPQPDDLRCGDAQARAQAAQRVFNGEAGPHRDIVVLNAAAGLVAAGAAEDLAQGVDAAGAALDEGRAASVLEGLVKVSQEQAAASVER